MFTSEEKLNIEELFSKALLGEDLSGEEAAQVWGLAKRRDNYHLYMLIRLLEMITRQVAKGDRCPVCGYTEEQNFLRDYNCFEEC